LFLKLDELKPILEEQGQIYAEKMVYELSKLIHDTFGKTVIGRTRFNEFIVLNRLLTDSDLLELVERLKLKVKSEKIVLNKKVYKLALLGVIVDLKKLKEFHKMDVVELETLTQLLRDQLSITIEIIKPKDFKNL
jgi:GGDEF domain-containing protein